MKRKYLDVLKESGVKVSLNESFFRAENSSYWIEEIPYLIKGLTELVKKANLYMNEAKKLGKEDYKSVALEIIIKVDPTIKNVFSKKRRGYSFITLTLRDGNGIVEKLLTVGDYGVAEVKYKIKLDF